MIKLFVSDFDGTLLNEMHVVSDETIKAIHALRESGVSFLPASGRDYLAIQQVLKPVGETMKCIAMNGGGFFNNNGEPLISYKMSKEKTLEVFNIIHKYDAMMDFYLENDRVTLVEENLKATYIDYLMRSSRMTLGEMIRFLNELNFDETIVQVKDINRIAEVGVVNLEANFADIDERNQCLKELKKVSGVSLTNAFGNNIEVACARSTKGDMVESVCELYGIKKEEVVVIGDNYNDVTMFQKFPNSYAMGNAVSELKEMTRFVADTNYNDGVAKVMYEVIERNKKEKETGIPAY